jgi:hypothetical protein
MTERKGLKELYYRLLRHACSVAHTALEQGRMEGTRGIKRDSVWAAGMLGWHMNMSITNVWCLSIEQSTLRWSGYCWRSPRVCMSVNIDGKIDPIMSLGDTVEYHIKSLSIVGRSLSSMDKHILELAHAV